mmetsp:Transcript_5586/g.6372  ORF Transcript_5586/g.6372 Transcript_5586/m.6372 type:complete len:415 (+) Transcript_5586:237-1481(+)
MVMNLRTCLLLASVLATQGFSSLKSKSPVEYLSEPISNALSSTYRVFTSANDAFRTTPSPLSITTLTDEILALEESHTSTSDAERWLTLALLTTARSSQLNRLLRTDRTAYIATATFLSSSIPREQLPNVQNIPHPRSGTVASLPDTFDDTQVTGVDYLGRELVPDCTLQPEPDPENPAEALLLTITRNIYSSITGTPRLTDKGIVGLVEEMRNYMLSPEGADPAIQQSNLVKTLYVLMTPVLPPFYRIFMGWKVPTSGIDPDWLVEFATQTLKLEEGKTYGPAFYAPLFTSIVAPYAFGFLVGPARVNLRSDGQYGGIVVNKCKFLQQSGCKGMCLHSCKLPAEQLFDDLGLPLRVIPNFDTQECQWSFGESSVSVEEDGDWPQGCLSGCGTREAVGKMRRNGVKGGELANCY